MNKSALLLSIALFIPNVTYASDNNFIKLLETFGDIVNMSIGILVTLALAVFFWGLVQYIFKLGGSKTPDNGRSLMVYGIVALFVMVSVWGLTSFIGEFLDIKSDGSKKPDIENILL
jgi:hypothetical protein